VTNTDTNSHARRLRQYEFFETPAPFTLWLFREMTRRNHQIAGRVFEPCVGSGAIVRATTKPHRAWFTNDLDETWPADVHKSATDETLWQAHEVDWTVTNTPFSLAFDIAQLAIRYSIVGVAMHLRASFHEVLKTGPRRAWLAAHPPTGILWLPRFAYQRSEKTGQWTTDSVCACWVVWVKDAPDQFISYAPETMLNDLKRFESQHRQRMDQIMTGGRL
jgi:hypothetical protein